MARNFFAATIFSLFSCFFPIFQLEGVLKDSITLTFSQVIYKLHTFISHIRFKSKKYVAASPKKYKMKN